MKKCSRCGESKDESMFQVRSASKDGLTASCKCCLSLYDKSRAKNPHRVEARRAYAQTEAGMESRRRSSKKYYRNHNDRAVKSRNEWVEKNKKKRKVHGIVSYAIRIGVLESAPCEICGRVKTHAHHDDYDKPLDVRWLCSLHHKQWHAANGEGKNG